MAHHACKNFVPKTIVFGTPAGHHLYLISRAVFHSSLNSDCEEISLIQQCRLLEEPYGTNFTDAVLQGDSSLSSVKKDLLKKDRQWEDSLISQHDSLKHLESLKDVPWCKVWDTVLDSGPNAAKYASSVFNILLGTIWWPPM